ncbi:hypothetical protein E2C01_087205 [Portunus trituberculatus]|uniref:Uncharacterized protein n=1 Tax=Portunus trituberculatus TaxID=210409 RepID=A0A5B7JCQ5_PORTR|nr:hypothetical protein [Portunus trituberculatus]
MSGCPPSLDLRGLYTKEECSSLTYTSQRNIPLNPPRYVAELV